jgi:hypothetical protein
MSLLHSARHARPSRAPVRLAVAIASATLLMLAALPAAQAQSDHDNHGQPAQPHVMKPKKDKAGTPADSGPAFDSTTDMAYHGGPVMRDVTNYAIFWNPSSPPAGYTGAMFDSNYREVIDRYFDDISGTPYLNILTQYGDSSGLPVPNTTRFGGDWIDTTTLPHAGTNADPLGDGDLRAAIDRAIAANPTWQGPSNSTMYYVFTGKRIIECSGGCFVATDYLGNTGPSSGFCAYHWNNGSKIYAFIPYASTGSCYGDDTTWPNGVGPDVSLDVTSHEQFEAYTDPFQNAWYDNVDGGAGENGDKCNFNYGPYESDGTNLVLSGHPYQLQREWSNGSPHGCVKRYGPRPATTVTGDLGFGNVPRGGSATRQVAVQNTGSGDLDILGAQLSPGSSAAFSLSPTSPTHATLRPGDTALYDVKVSPSASASNAGPLTATLQLDTDDTTPNSSGQPTNSQLTATTSVPASATVGLPALTVTGSLNFGTVPRGASATREVIVQNTGTADLHVTNVAFSGDPAYSQSPPAPATGTLAPGDSLTVQVTFSPSSASTTAGPVTGTLSITTDAPSVGSASVPATGTVGLPRAALSPGALDFGVVCPGQSVDKELTVTNTGTAPLTISAVDIGAGSSTGLSVLPIPGLPQTLPIGGHLAFTVRFAPTGPLGGPISGTVVVTTDDPVNPALSVPISGSVGQANVTLGTNALDFGGVPTDDRTSPHTASLPVTVTNSGNCGLTITSLALSGPTASDYAISGAPVLPLSIGAGSSVTLTVTFNPRAAGLRNATLSIGSSDPITPIATVSLTGQGLVPTILTSAPSLTYAPTVIASQAPGYGGMTTALGFTNTGQSELIVDVLSTTGAPFSVPGPASPPSRYASNDHGTAQVTFAPTAAGKFVGAVTIADNDPQGGASSAVPLCGEGVQRGIRVLAVNAAGVPFSTVKALKLQAKGTAQNVNVNLSNLSLSGVATSCVAGQQEQYENQSLPATDTLNQRASYYTLSVTAGGKSTTVTFVLGVAEFKTIMVTIK